MFIFSYEICHVFNDMYNLNEFHIVGGISNDKYIKYSQTNMKSIVRGGIDD